MVITLETNLIFHYSISDVLNHATKFLCIFRVFQESGDCALLCQCSEVSQYSIQFSSYPPGQLLWYLTFEDVDLLLEKIPPLCLPILTVWNWPSKQPC